MKTVTAIIPVKKNSSRLPNKNILPFGETNLLIHKIRQLQYVEAVNRIVVSSYSKGLKGLFPEIYTKGYLQTVIEKEGV